MLSNKRTYTSVATDGPTTCNFASLLKAVERVFQVSGTFTWLGPSLIYTRRRLRPDAMSLVVATGRIVLLPR